MTTEPAEPAERPELAERSEQPDRPGRPGRSGAERLRSQPYVPLVGHDLDCGDIGFRVTGLGSDPHGFDRESDGVGCESYG